MPGFLYLLSEWSLSLTTCGILVTFGILVTLATILNFLLFPVLLKLHYFLKHSKISNLKIPREKSWCDQCAHSHPEVFTCEV